MSETKMTRFRWVMCTLLFVATTVNYLDRDSNTPYVKKVRVVTTVTYSLKD